MRRYYYPHSKMAEPSKAEFEAFMEGFREWCKQHWPEYLVRTSCPPPGSRS